MRVTTTLPVMLTALLSFAAGAQNTPPKPESKDYVFTTDKANPVPSMKNQYRSGTCWCFSALSFLESEVIKAKGLSEEAYPDFSEMFIVRHSYHDRAIKYVRLNGYLNMAAGSGFGDVLEVVRDYGLVPQDVYTGMQYGYDLPVQGELDAVLKGYVQAVIKNPNKKLTPVWSKGFDGILDAYLGTVPDQFTQDGITYTPASYRDAMGIDPEDYVNISSYTHHPFYQPFVIEVEDNWRWGSAYNVPLDDFMAIIDNAIDNGYTVLWGGDVSEPGFTRDGIAVLLDQEVKTTAGSDQERWTGKADEKKQPAADKKGKKGAKPAPAVLLPELREVSQELRQQMYDEKTSTDDHGMHLYGIAHDQNGTKYYLIKNSWGESGAFKGVWYMSEKFVQAKTLNYVVNKKALPADIAQKLGIQQ